jgi:hypothetical protein
MYSVSALGMFETESPVARWLDSVMERFIKSYLDRGALISGQEFGAGVLGVGVRRCNDCGYV